MKRTIAAALLIAALPSVHLSASPASAGGPLCRGREATHVGTPGEQLTTTPGPDVVITNGAGVVRTLNGDDVICATRVRFVYIVPGGGDDLVDATGFPGDNLETALGGVGVDGSSGDDTYLGGDQLDQVLVWSGTPADHKDIHLDGGDDYLSIDQHYPGRVTAELGVGSDEYWNDRPRAGVIVDGEVGRDDLVTACIGCDSTSIWLSHGTITVDAVAAGRAIGFEDVDLINVGSRVVPRAFVSGTRGPNKISVSACLVEVHGRRGDDSLLGGSLEARACDHHRAAVYGEGGDDSMTGLIGNDYLRGGGGQDGAAGGRGRDLCRAETKVDCER